MFPESDSGGSLSAAAVIHGSVMLFRGVDIRMSQHICHKIDIARFLIKGGAIGTSQFVRRNFLGSGNLRGIFLTKFSTA